MAQDQDAKKKPALQVIEGEGGKPTDTRPPVARFGRHTLPEAVIVIRRFVEQYGAPRTFDAPPNDPTALARAASTAPARGHVRARTFVLGVVVACVATALLAFALLRTPRPEMTENEHKPAPLAAPSPAVRATAAAALESRNPLPPSSISTAPASTAPRREPALGAPRRPASPARPEAPPKPRPEPAYQREY